MKVSDVIIVGGGAAGLAAGIAAARSGAHVTILEKNERAGKKILMTGNGRCNLSNVAIGQTALAAYSHPNFVEPTLAAYDCVAIRDFFRKLGLLTILDGQGWVFPITRSATSVLDVLLREADSCEIDIRTNQEVVAIDHKASGWELRTADGAFSGSSVVLACGATPLLAALDLPLVPSGPILGALRTETEAIRGLDGIRAHGCLTLLDEGQRIAVEQGELLFREYGISGIAAFNLSRTAKVGQMIAIDFFPEQSSGDLVALLQARLDANPQVAVAKSLLGLLHSRLAQAIVRAVGLSCGTTLDINMLSKLANIMKDFRLRITSVPDRRQAQVTRGGLAIEGVDPNTLACQNYPKLYAAGECLDIDGPCGGYNLHWAWASGLVAGVAAAFATAEPEDATGISNAADDAADLR